MKLELNINSTDKEAIIKKRIITYFNKVGYKLNTSKSVLEFQRGSFLGTWLAFSPRGWDTTATVLFSSDSKKILKSSITYSIDTSGQLVTEKERLFWKRELEDLEKFASTGEVEESASIKHSNSAIIQNLLANLLNFLVIILFVLIGIFVFKTYLATILMLVLGVVVGVILMISGLKIKIPK
jgi:hypothetical protein